MIQAMYSGVSGIQAHQTRLDVVGNNIANVNTIGYKAGRVTFYDQLSQTLRGASRPQGGRGSTDPLQVGLGVKVGSITAMHTQGALQQTGRPSDLAIQGNGFFLVGDGIATSYTRDGAFTLDAEGNLVSATTGVRLLGWRAGPDGTVDSSVPITPASNIRIPIGTMTAVKTTGTVTLAGNLDAAAAPGGTYTRTAQVYDSLGESHDVAFRLSRDAAATPPAAATWTWTTSVDGGPYSAPGGANSGTLNFDADGALIGAPGTVTVTPGTGASAFTLTPQWGEVSQLSGAYSMGVTAQDGFPFGALQSYTIGEDGLVTGLFSNGLTRDLGQIAVAQFANPAGLNKVGSNLFRLSGNSGEPQITAAGAASAGLISAGFLEQSNVNLAEEFTSMIVTQRGFQANTRIVTASDEILQDLLQMKR